MQPTRSQQFVVVLLALWVFVAMAATAQEPPAQEKPTPPPVAHPGQEYSGMYSFLQEGEFVQVTVEEAGRVTGFVSRFGDLDSDKGAFLDHFFKNGTLHDNKLSFTTEMVHGKSFEFTGTIERGEGKKPGDEAYFVIRGKLTENSTDSNKKVSARSRDVAFKAFPRDAAAESGSRN